MIWYIREIGKIVNFVVNLVGRLEFNVFDVILGLEDLGLIQGFFGNLDVYYLFYSFGIIIEIS